MNVLPVATPALSRQDDRRLTTPARRALNMPSVAPTIIAVVISIAALRLASGFIVPVVVCLLVAAALEPVVGWLARTGLPRNVASALAVAGLLAALGGITYGLSDDLAAAVNRLPEATTQLQQELTDLRGRPNGPIRALEMAADNIEAVASEAAGRQTSRSLATPEPALRLRESLVLGTFRMLGLTGSVIMLAFFVYAVLASGDLFRRKLVRIAGPTLSQRRAAVETLDDINKSIGRFLWVVVSMNLLVAVLTWIGFSALGLAHAATWGLVGGALNTIPYVGSAAAAGIFFLAGLLQFDRLDMALLTAGIFLVITTIEGTWLKPRLLGRTARMNSVAIFVGLLLGGWAWGAWGLLMAYPLIMVTKTIADRVERLQPLGELLGE